MRTFCEQNFLHQYVLFPLAQLFIHGNSGYLFPKRWNWQMCHTHQAFRHPLRTFSSKLRTFPMVKSKTIAFFHDRTQQYTPVLVAKTPHELLPEKELLSGHYAAYSEIAGIRPFWCLAFRFSCSSSITFSVDCSSPRRCLFWTISSFSSHTVCSCLLNSCSNSVRSRFAADLGISESFFL